MIYEPREDSFLLEIEVKKYSKGKKVLDVGSGSGILAKAALYSGAKGVLCVDINNECVKYLKKEGFKAIQSDLFSNVRGKFDLIVFNPPYLPEDEREDSESSRITSGGKKGNEIIIRFLKESLNHLEENGIILIVVSNLTGKINFKKFGFKMRIIASKKIFMEKLEVWELRK